MPLRYGPFVSWPFHELAHCQKNSLQYRARTPHQYRVDDRYCLSSTKWHLIQYRSSCPVLKGFFSTSRCYRPVLTSFVPKRCFFISASFLPKRCFFISASFFHIHSFLFPTPYHRLSHSKTHITITNITIILFSSSFFFLSHNTGHHNLIITKQSQSQISE